MEQRLFDTTTTYLKSYANMIKQLQVRMRTEIVSFSFIKKNGELRIARGTLRSDVCPIVKGGGKPTPEHLQLYYDVDKSSWRSFEKEKFVEFLEAR